MSEIQYPISEMFVSPQGEGRHTGTLMQFIRFGGCTVGKSYPQQSYEDKLFPIYTTMCTTYDGRTFPCDTDYRVKEKLTIKQIRDWLLQHNVSTVLLTGGEPLMRDITPLVSILDREGFDIHVETSGTVKPDLNQKLWKMLDWICVSPKKGFQWEYAELGIAHEFKLLVDENFDWEKVPAVIKKKAHKVSLSPINDEHTINHANVQRCLELQRTIPGVKVTMQMHKLWGVR